MIRVSIRFNGVSVRVIKQGIVPCKLLLIAASEITVFVGRNITDATPIFHQAPTKALISAQTIAPTILF